jgi:hypothetical protein
VVMTENDDPTVVDLDSGPDALNAAAALALKSDPVPVPVPPDTTVNLPGGLINLHGQLIDTAEVQELNGEDEEFLAKEKGSDTVPKIITSILCRGVVQLGDFPLNRTTFNSLLVGDRLALYIGIRRATYGNDVPLSLICPVCNTTFAVAVELHDLEVRQMEDRTKRTFEVSLRHGGVAEVRLMTGDVHEAMEEAKIAAEQNTIVLSKTITKLNGSQIIDKAAVLRLGSMDRRNIIKALSDNQPGPILEGIKVPCSACGEVREITLSVIDLFRT